jgi:hypothetical protein
MAFWARTPGELERASPDVAMSIPSADLSWRDAESLEHHLPAGEEILWAGRPAAGLALPDSRFSLRLGFIAVCALIVFLGNVGAGASAATVVGATAVWLAIGYLVGRRFLFTAGRRRRMLYLVTTARVARVQRGRSGEQMDSITLSAIPRLSVSVTASGRGTINFGQLGPDPPANTGSWTAGASRSDEHALAFANVPDAAYVARLISSLQAHQSR